MGQSDDICRVAAAILKWLHMVRVAHIRQVISYLKCANEDGWYYGDKWQFRARHEDIMVLAVMMERALNGDNGDDNGTAE